MGKYVIRFGLGTECTKVFLNVDKGCFSTTTRPRLAKTFDSRKDAVDIQNTLLSLSPVMLNDIIHKDKTYADHVSISVMHDSLNVRNKLYLYNPEV